MMRNTHIKKEDREKEGYYDEFVGKFKRKLTSDDCYTPENIYNAVREWAVREYDIGKDVRIIRPFWPDADYQSEDYSGDCVVIDNPPFSIISDICRWFDDKKIRFFLFGQAVTLFNVCRGELKYVICGEPITFDNGAKIGISFVTNMGDAKIICAPDLQSELHKINLKNQQIKTNKPPKYDYPDNVCTSARLNYISTHGISLRIMPEDVHYIGELDEQKMKNKRIFGCGFLLSEKAAAEKAAAEKAAADKAGATIWVLSEREKDIISRLGDEAKKENKHENAWRHQEGAGMLHD